ncbi:MAG TPA: ChbG/HpnK family deacetylase [Candidatus Eisenbacteria bacterium]|jgi:predicted glycoside hydrolase/deacetylase ChbG (UPF0249 family)
MRYLIVNADDLGAGPGVNRGILEAHARGIVTSASLMVDTPWSAEAAVLSRAAPSLSVGLHVALPAAADRLSLEVVRDELRRQFARFEMLMGRGPTHLDSHHNVHRDPALLASFLELSHRSGLPLRAHSPVRYFSKFYGQWGGKNHPEQVGVESLSRMLAVEIGEGLTELSCHPGYVDPLVPSGYALEREVELRTLCDPLARRAVEANGFALVSYHDLDRLTAVHPRR